MSFAGMDGAPSAEKLTVVSLAEAEVLSANEPAASEDAPNKRRRLGPLGEAVGEAVDDDAEDEADESITDGNEDDEDESADEAIVLDTNAAYGEDAPVQSALPRGQHAFSEGARVAVRFDDLPYEGVVTRLMKSGRAKRSVPVYKVTFDDGAVHNDIKETEIEDLVGAEMHKTEDVDAEVDDVEEGDEEAADAILDGAVVDKVDASGGEEEDVQVHALAVVNDKTEDLEAMNAALQRVRQSARDVMSDLAGIVAKLEEALTA